MTDAKQTRIKTVLTHRGLESLRPEEIAYRIPDLRAPGLAVRVAPSGLKTWDVAFRIRGAGIVRRLSLGPFPAVSLDAARERVNVLTSAAKAGRDLLAEESNAQQEAEARITIGDLIEAYLNRSVRGKLRTAYEMEQRLKRILQPLTDRPADEIRRRDLRGILDKAADRGCLREAEKQRQLLRCLFRWALSQDHIENDPSYGLASFGSSPRRDRVLSQDEIKLLWGWLGSGTIPLDYSEAMKLQLATGARIGEVVGLTSDEIDQAKWIWTLPKERSKNGRERLTPIVGLAREIIQKRLEIYPSGALFRTEDGRALSSNCMGSLLVKHRRKIAIDHFTSHDLRRTVATSLVDLGVVYDVVAAVLGHEQGGKNVQVLLRHYIRSDFVDRKREALTMWDRWLREVIKIAR